MQPISSRYPNTSEIGIHNARKRMSSHKYTVYNYSPLNITYVGRLKSWHRYWIDYTWHCPAYWIGYGIGLVQQVWSYPLASVIRRRHCTLASPWPHSRGGPHVAFTLLPIYQPLILKATSSLRILLHSSNHVCDKWQSRLAALLSLSPRSHIYTPPPY